MSQAEQTQDTTGRLLAGRYRLGEVLGRGGMGTVWRAVDETLGRTVAVKELRFPSSVDEDEKRRLITRTLREAKAIARIRSSGAVTVYDVVDEDDRPWIVMELIEGSSLADVVREEGVLTPRRTAEVGLAVLDVLRAAHTQGILHRDVKPSNVLIADDGRVVLTDFGIAQVEGDPSVTSTGMLVGAPSYISPERARGHKPGPPADLWSLGGLLYACVEGAPPYDKGSGLATLTAVMTEPLEPPKQAGPLAEVIQGLLVKDPDQRLDDAGARALLSDALNALERAESELPVAPDATRTMALPPAPTPAPAGEPEIQPESRPATESRTPPGPRREPAAGGEAGQRLHGALRSVRNAAAAAKAGGSSPSAAPAGTPGERSRESARASLTDVVSRRTLLVVAVTVALALLGTVLTFALGDRGRDGGSQTKDETAASSGTAAGSDQGKDPGAAKSSPAEEPQGDGKDDDDPDKDGKPGNDDSEKPDEDSSGPGGGLPEGYKTIKDSRFRFSMALPEGWKSHDIAGQGSGGIYSESGGFPRVQVDFGAHPTSDAAAAWRDLEPSTKSRSSGYRLLRIKKVEYRKYPTAADWSFERIQDGDRMQVLNRGFKVDNDQGYAILITCRKGAWDKDECRTLRQSAFKSFKPLG